MLGRRDDVCRALERRQTHHQQTADHRDKGHTVQEKTHRNTDRANHQAGNRWADNARTVHDRAIERNRIEQIFAARHFDGERLTRGHVEAHRHAIERSDNDNEQWRGEPGPGASCEQKRANHLRGLRRDNDRAFRVKISQRSTPDREQHHRRGTDGGDGAEQ